VRDAYDAYRSGDYGMAVVYVAFTICDVGKTCQGVAVPFKALARAAKGMRTAGRTAARGAARVRPPLQTPERIVVDSRGNAIPLNMGEYLTRSPDGRWVQVRDASGNPTGVWIDGPHNPRTHPDPRAQQPHAHVPGVTNPDGTPWLPIK
jgi:hypothetical protein